MFRLIKILFILLSYCWLTSMHVYSSDIVEKEEGTCVMAQVTEKDTLYLVYLRELHVFPKMQFKNKAQEKFYWRTVRDVKRTLPYARQIAQELARTNAALEKISTKKAQKAYMDTYEKGLLKKYEPDFRKLTASQGQMLMLLVDRECDRTSYELIKLYKGNVTAFFWQGFARIFGNNLKAEYDASDKDQITERIIVLVESGQL